MKTHIQSMIETEDEPNKRIIDDIKNRLRQGKELITCDLDELQYIQKPIGKSIYRHANEERKKRKNKYISDERIICDLCGKDYRRSNKSFHEKTHYHLTYKLVNDKFKKLILN
jgi:hypothetical protein